MARQPGKPARTRTAGPLAAFQAERAPLTDIYHAVLSLPLSGVIALMAVMFLTLNLVFAGLYMLAPGGVGNLRPGDFWNAFFFSVQTFGSIGYGYMFPRSYAADAIVTIESFTSLVYVAMGTGLVFARVSRPTARVSFSRTAVIHDFDGVPTLMFRAANRRSNQILEAEVMVSLAHDAVTREGHAIRRFEELRTARSRSPLFALSWTVMHPIDAKSPLHGATPESLAREQAQLVIVLSGVDDRFHQRVHARHLYAADDILWGKRFADIIKAHPDGRRTIDFARFHDVEEA